MVAWTSPFRLVDSGSADGGRITVDVRASSPTSAITRVDVDNGTGAEVVLEVTVAGLATRSYPVPPGAAQVNRTRLRSEFGRDITPAEVEWAGPASP